MMSAVWAKTAPQRSASAATLERTLIGITLPAPERTAGGKCALVASRAQSDGGIPAGSRMARKLDLLEIALVCDPVGDNEQRDAESGGSIPVRCDRHRKPRCHRRPPTRFAS